MRNDDNMSKRCLPYGLKYICMDANPDNFILQPGISSEECVLVQSEFGVKTTKKMSS